MSNQRLGRSSWERRYSTNLRITDACVVVGAVVLAQYIRFGQTPATPRYMSNYVTAYSAFIAIIWLCALAGFRARSPRYIGAGMEEYRRVIGASLWTFGGIAIAELLVKLEVSRGYLAVALPAGLFGLVVNRVLWRRKLMRGRAEGRYLIAVLAVGELSAVQNLVNELADNPMNGYRVVGVGICGYGAPRRELLVANGQQIPIIGDETHALQAVRTCGADTVAIVGTEQFGFHGIRKLIWELDSAGVDLVVSPCVMDVALSRLAMRPIAGIPLLHIEKPQYRGAERFTKRGFDFCFALVALTMTLPVLLIAAIAIKANSRGPVLYTSERIGIDGKPFQMMKLRTMIEDADKQLETLLASNQSDGLLFKIREDPRVTPAGRILRRFSIDELPQFINVLRQEMSVVGPRPPLRQEVEAYDDDVQRRLLVKPGITGLWQVSGRSDLSWAKSVRLDLSYVDNWSMVGDIVIIAKTIRAVLERKGAY